MNKRVLLPFLLLLFFHSSCENKKRNLSIAVAANAKQAVEKIAEAFEKKHDIDIDLISASSGKLSAQIKAGAPFDIFISADLTYPQELYKSGYSESQAKVYALGQLILIANSTAKDLTITHLVSNEIKHIAISNPKTAPYGIAALESLKYYKLDTLISKKLVYGESVGQCNQFFISGAADLALTSQSILYSYKFDSPISFLTIDSLAYSPIKQGLIQVKNGNKVHRFTEQFYLFLFTKEAQDILRAYGYKIPID